MLPPCSELLKLIIYAKLYDVICHKWVLSVTYKDARVLVTTRYAKGKEFIGNDMEGKTGEVFEGAVAAFAWKERRYL